MISHTTERFRKAFAELPKKVKKEARFAYKQFQKEPYHPSLHFKRVHSGKPVYSVRINAEYRAVGIRKGDTVIWF